MIPAAYHRDKKVVGVFVRFRAASSKFVFGRLQLNLFKGGSYIFQ
jgi:hypothetical protein